MARYVRYISTKSGRARTRASGGRPVLPWVLLGEATEILRDRPKSLSPEDRARLRALVRQAGGRGINLSLRERVQVTVLIQRANARPVPAVPKPLVASRRASSRRKR